MPRAHVVRSCRQIDPSGGFPEEARHPHLTGIVPDIGGQLPAGEKVEIEVTEEPGTYEIVFAQGEAVSSYTFVFEPEDGQFTMG